MRVIGYLRVSTNDQECSVRVQEEKIRAWAELHCAEIVDIVTDRCTAAHMRRPGAKEAIQRVLDGEADALVVYKLDRLTRSVKDLHNVVSKLNEANKGVVFIKENLDTVLTPIGRLLMTIVGACAEFEREQISARIKDALDAKRRDGILLGSAPYGWRRVDKYRFETVPEQQRILRYILMMRERGVTCNRIARNLNRSGHPSKTGGKWWAPSVQQVILSYQRMCG